MNYENIPLKIEFKNSKQKKTVTLKSLVESTANFLEFYGEQNIVGKKISSIIKEEDGETRLKNLLKAADYENDVKGFFIEIIKILEKTNPRKYLPIKINNIMLPPLMIYSILEVIIPGNRMITIKSVRQLEKLNNVKYPEDKRKDLQKVIKLYPVRLSQNIIRQMRVSRAVAYQYMPFADELNREGQVHTWVGQFHRGIVEQMYKNRIIFILNMTCPVYCRFCFRKHKECRNQKVPTQAHVKDAVNYVKNSPNIKEIVLTGGDAFLRKANLTYAIDGLSKIPHVQTLRVATRSISYFPYLFYTNNSFWINYLKRKNLELEAKGKRIEVATHFIHPEELSIESLDIITELSQSGITVYTQTPLLKNCNDGGEELKELYKRLREAGAEIHYIFMPCSPLKGNRRYVLPISAGIETASYLRANVSDRAMPKICTATEIGKIDWNLSGWAVEKDKKDDRYVWIRTPYTQEYFSEFAPILQLRKKARVNSEGTLDVKFMADIGNKKYFWGAREPKSVDTTFPLERELTKTSYDRSKEALSKLQSSVLDDQRFTQTIVPTGSKTLFRTHITRVELDLGADEKEMEKNIQYIKDDDNILDVVISQKQEVLESMYKLKKLLKRLDKIFHVNTVRLRSHKFNYEPSIFTQGIINQLRKINRLSIVNPRRLEIETQFLHSSEILPEHKTLAGNLRKNGITVYNNTPLLPFINDTEDEILNISYKCRESGIEFHHLYLAGLPIQSSWSEKYPVDVSIIINIATKNRREESGRSLPRFIIRTSLGEVDFGLTSEIVHSDDKGNVYVKLLPYNLKYFKSMYPEFSWPKGVNVDKNGHPIVNVNGLKRTQEFLFD